MAQDNPVSQRVREFLQARFPDALVSEDNFRNQQSFTIKAERLVDLCRALQEDADPKFNYLSDITCVDWLGHAEEKKGRFEVVYNLYSLSHACRLLLKVRLHADYPQLDSLTPLWNGANWLEREVWDLFGVVFVGHPDLTKIVTADDLEGHPLRKDFPLTYETPVFSWNKDDPPEVIR